MRRASLGILTIVASLIAGACSNPMSEERVNVVNDSDDPVAIVWCQDVEDVKCPITDRYDVERSNCCMEDVGRVKPGGRVVTGNRLDVPYVYTVFDVSDRRIGCLTSISRSGKSVDLAVSEAEPCSSAES
jgi:hypothetical protein